MVIIIKYYIIIVLRWLKLYICSKKYIKLINIYLNYIYCIYTSVKLINITFNKPFLDVIKLYIKKYIKLTFNYVIY